MSQILINRYFPTTRLRRLRQNETLRLLTQENTLSANDLIQPLFICDGKKQKIAIPSMPDIYRYSLDNALKYIEKLVENGINTIALFPAIEADKKNPLATEALNPQGLVPEALQIIKKHFPDIMIIADIALDPYTSHGQDGLVNEAGYILNDETVEVLREQALLLAQSGADIVAPSDMMDGRVGAIRGILEENNLVNTLILSYSAKYASSFYGPFRDAVGSKSMLGKSDKKNYQMNPANSDEALHEVYLDLQEGADIVMVKPATLYMDIIRRIHETYHVPTFAYHVSGEYSMLKSAVAQGWLDEKSCVLETLLGLKRAGSSAILTYYALNASQWLKQL